MKKGRWHLKACIKRLLSPLAHPIAAFEDFREKNTFPLLPSFVILLLFFLARIMERQFSGFIFNLNDPEKINVFFIFLETIGIFLLWVGCNWAVSTLFDGKGRVREIWVVSAISLIPYVAGIYLYVLFSNLLAEDEGVFLSWMLALGLLYSALLLFGALSAVHEYTFGKVLWSSLITIGFMLIILFVCVLLFSLFQQFCGFFRDLMKEILFRL